MNLKRRQLDDLVSYRNHKNPVVSFYLNVSPPREYMIDLNSLMRKASRDLENNHGPERVEGLKKVLADMEEYARAYLAGLDNTRLVAIFADNDGFRQEYRLPVALPSRLVVEAEPYVRPLSLILDEFPRYAVLIVDNNKARLFSLFMDDFEERPEILAKKEAPDQFTVHHSLLGDNSVRGGLRDEGVRLRITDQVHRHMKGVADNTLEYFKHYDFNRLIIGGLESKGSRVWLKNHLHSYLRQCLVGEFDAGTSDPLEDLREKALETARKYERRHEKELIDWLFEKKGEGMGALGVESVIEALMLGQVHTLIMDNNFRKEGTVCAADHILSTYQETCPVCGREMERADDLAERMVEEALLQNSEIEHVFAEHEDFMDYQVGAILRFSL